MDVLGVVRRIAFAPKRFLDWVYTDRGRTRPGLGEQNAQLESLGAGVATTQRNAEAADARGRHTAAALGEDRDG